MVRDGQGGEVGGVGRRVDGGGGRLRIMRHRGGGLT